MFAQTIAAAALVLPFAAQVLATSSCTRSYTVQAGDICDSISAAQNVSTYQLATVNSGIDSRCDNLTPGENLCLGYTGQDCTTTYVVKANDTCELITSAYSVNSTILYGNNPQINADCTNIYIGELLCVGGTIPAPAAGAFIPATSIPATATAAVPVTTTYSSAAPTPTDDGDDDDLPWCDEL